MTDYAVGRRAYGFCERCAFRWPLGDLKAETYKGIDKNNRVCPECWDAENPQSFVGDYQFDDPQSLKRPVPDLGLAIVNEIPANVVPFSSSVAVGLNNVIDGNFSIENGTLKNMSLAGVTERVVLYSDNAVNSTHGVFRDFTANYANDITFTAYIKGAGSTLNDEIGLRINDSIDSQVYTIIWNYNGTYIGTGFTAGTPVEVARSNTIMPNGLLRLSMTINFSTGTGAARVRILGRRSSVGSVVYIGDGSPLFFYQVDPEYSNP